MEIAFSELLFDVRSRDEHMGVAVSGGHIGVLQDLLGRPDVRTDLRQQSDFPVQTLEQRLHPGSTQLTLMAHDTISSVPADQKAHPTQVFFGLKAIVPIPNALPDSVEKVGRTKNGPA